MVLLTVCLAQAVIPGPPVLVNRAVLMVIRRIVIIISLFLSQRHLQILTCMTLSRKV